VVKPSVGVLGGVPVHVKETIECGTMEKNLHAGLSSPDGSYALKGDPKELDDLKWSWTDTISTKRGNSYIKGPGQIARNRTEHENF
jgi:hypothetical protein